jgi:integrase
VDDLSISWLDHLRAEHVPPNTIAARARVLRSVGNPGTATREEVEAWWATRRDLAPATRSNDLACLRTFYKWADRWDHRDIATDPTRRIDAPKVDKGLPRPISRADMLTLLAVLPEDLARAVALGGYAGLRVSEAAALMWADIDIETRRARIMSSKGHKSRLVALGPILIDFLLPDTGGNVVTSTKHVVTAATLQRRVNRAIQRAGIDCTYHALRHRFGSIAYQATRDLVAVGRQMGHSSPISTMVYAAASDEVADQIAEAVTR